jgi:dimethylhistidine N-methyltransferase
MNKPHLNPSQWLSDLEPTREEFRAAVRAGLAAPRKSLPCKFFYDAEGSALFERICELPEYYPTRTECRILQDHAQEIASLVGPEIRLVEFGSGAGTKIRLLLAALNRPAAYVPVDISRDHLLAAAASLAGDFPALRIAPVCADYTKPFALPALPGRIPKANVGFFPGSTIGNFTRDEAVAFLTRARRLLGAPSWMIVGADLVKDPRVLEAAYDDAAGVTAAFNLNLLHRINRELGADFHVGNFAHRAVWNAELSRMEMYLVSLHAQSVCLEGEIFHFDAGETIHTENSCKYTIETFRDLAREAGYESVAAWTDGDDLFSVHMLKAV